MQCSLGNAGSWGGEFGEIIDGFPTPHAVLGGVTRVKTSAAVRFQAAGDNPAFFTLFNAAMARPAAVTARARLETLGAMAAALYAGDVTDLVLDAWDLLRQIQVREQTGGVFYLGGPVMLRWLIRPLVARQELLTPEERAYWEPYLYQSRTAQPESYLDYLNVTGKPVAASWDVATPTCIAVDSIDAELRAAAALLEQAHDKTADKAAAGRLHADALRPSGQGLRGAHHPPHPVGGYAHLRTRPHPARRRPPAFSGPRGARPVARRHGVARALLHASRPALGTRQCPRSHQTHRIVARAAHRHRARQIA
ncbi:MAG: hypothetical protein ABIF71_08840 [Planctomycetota bacterium]